MKIKTIAITIMLFAVLIFPNTVRSGGSSILFSVGETDSFFTANSTNPSVLFYAFDLRDRETFVQYTFPSSDTEVLAHIQIFDVSNNCNENDFFDVYTPNDTHIYNMRDIQTNDGNPSGVVLPDNSYGILIITSFRLGTEQAQIGVGNFRIVDDNGYEYRTNAVRYGNTEATEFIDPGQIRSSTFNFNTKGGIGFSDVMGITAVRIETEGPARFEWQAAPVQNVFFPFDVDIYDLNEVPFSCRDVVFSCVNDDNPLREQILENSGINVANFEYGINNVIPHSKNGELLCPGNTISEGFVVLTPEPFVTSFEISRHFFTAFIGLNNGNGRGSMDSIWSFNWRQQGLPLSND